MSDEVTQKTMTRASNQGMVDSDYRVMDDGDAYMQRGAQVRDPTRNEREGRSHPHHTRAHLRATRDCVRRPRRQLGRAAITIRYHVRFRFQALIDMVI